MRLSYGVGFIGDGKYNSKTLNGKPHQTWRDMLRRCYSPKYHADFPSYIGCSVHSDWHNFQNFCEDYIHMIGEPNFVLDKDILIKGNKLYSKETCCLVPAPLNNLLTKSNRNRGNSPIGVSRHKQTQKYEVRLRINNKNLYLGLFDTEEEAFAIYKMGKQNHIKHMARVFESKLDPKVYTALINYKVEIHD